MYLFLLGFGALLSVAGIGLAASGLSIADHTFDASLVTPGIVAVVGGLLLIGLGFALRLLQRIEHALATRPPMPRPARPGETPEAAATSAPTAEAPSEPSRMPLPVKITRLPHPVPPPAPLEKRAEDVPQIFPYVARVGPAPVDEDTDFPAKDISTRELATRDLASRDLASRDIATKPLPAVLTPAAHHDDAEEAAAESVGPFVPRPFKARNGAAAPARVSPRLDARARAPLTTERPRGPAFDALWPKGPRRAAAAAQAAQLQEKTLAPEIPEPMVEEPELDPSTLPAANSPAANDATPSAATPAGLTYSNAAPDEAVEPITILKSGIVDGMAYTLYSDGSIEAQLPQGMLRFGSIAELRAHIEQDS